MDSAPILVLAYNRPDYLKELLEFLHKLEVPKLYISIDGPKQNSETDYKLVQACRALANESRTWCDTEVNILQSNNGCFKGVSLGIDWFFTREVQGIILEDDLVFSEDLLIFLTRGLQHFKADKNVGSICGYRHAGNNQELSGVIKSEFVSFPSSWGWATWNSKWSLFERDIAQFSNIQLGIRSWKYGGLSNLGRWRNLRARLISGELDSWA